MCDYYFFAYTSYKNYKLARQLWKIYVTIIANGKSELA